MNIAIYHASKLISNNGYAEKHEVAGKVTIPAAMIPSTTGGYVVIDGRSRYQVTFVDAPDMHPNSS